MKINDNIKNITKMDLSIKRLGETLYLSPILLHSVGHASFVSDEERILSVINTGEIKALEAAGIAAPTFEKAGPREKLYFPPGKTVSAVITCGGLCPGLNSVIRGIVLMNYYRYGNPITYGVRYGYEGLVKEYGHPLEMLRPDEVADIDTLGGSMLGSSRGNQHEAQMVDRLQELGINVLYAIGGDGTQRAAMDIIKEIEKRNLKISVIGVPKTIDNDINFIDKSFGVETAFSEACAAVRCAHTEAKGAPNCIGIVKVMGRESGFIAANASLATGDVNYCLIPEQDFDLDGPNGLLQDLERRVLRRKHAVIVVAEGAGEKYTADPKNVEYDASGNKKIGDIGLFLKEKIVAHFKSKGINAPMRYIDPSYIIRSVPPTPNDAIFCFQLAQAAVHAGMTGRTGMIAGYLNGQFIHLPMNVATLKRKKIDLDSQLWQSVLESTGQPVSMLNTEK